MRRVSLVWVGLVMTFVCGPLLAGETKKEAPKASPKPAAAKEAGPGVVNINTATKEELMLLPGIGKATAEAILAYRKEKGNFKTVDDLKNVKGIGDKKLAALKPYLTVTGKTTLKEKIAGTTPPKKKTTTEGTKEEPKKEETKKEGSG
ncbi:MAG: helix-hairpin-helix domain-containing protein [Abditibacteriales bacterium]|nr:helix-hairpin-helix domain-containing protein [Abditibacteriales bacterium]